MAATDIVLDGLDDASSPPAPLIGTSNVFSLLTMHFITPILRLGSQRPLTTADIPPLPDVDLTSRVTKRFATAWREMNATSIVPVIVSAFWRRAAFSSVAITISYICVFANPFLVRAFVEFLTTPSLSATTGYMLTIALFVTNSVASLAGNNSFFHATRVASNIRDALMATIYAKSLRLSNASRLTATTGQTVNLMASDTQRVYDMVLYWNFLWAPPLLVIVIAIVLAYNYGLAALFGITTLAALIPIQYLGQFEHQCPLPLTLLVLIGLLESGMHLSARYRRGMLLASDQRIMFSTEMLAGVRVIKQYAWEPSAIAKIAALRASEISHLAAFVNTSQLTQSIVIVWPAIVSSIIFTSYALLGNEITPVTVFFTLSLVTALRTPLFMFQNGIQCFASGMVSVARINNFLCLPDLHPYINRQHPPGAITITNATFEWTAIAPTLHNITLGIQAGQLVAVVGSVAAGKSSLLMAILGEMALKEGSVAVGGDIAYTDQKAWIRNMSVRDNILFGCAFHEARYAQVLEAAALTPDMAVLPAGDMTDIGEQGINLSGGQKARIMFARAIYTCSPINLFDDPFASVDTATAEIMFKHGVRHLLNGATRVLALNSNLHLLSHVDRIVVMINGAIADTFTSNEEFAKAYPAMVHDDDIKRRTSSKEFIIAEAPAIAERATMAVGKELIGAETRQTGTVQGSVYKRYCEAATSPKLALVWAVVIVFLFALDQGTRAGMDLQAAIWAQTAPSWRPVSWWISAIWIWVGLHVLFFVIRCALLNTVMVRASRSLHDTVIARVLHAPITTFFDVTPVGRIINRISKDLDQVDVALNDFLSQLLKFSMMLLAAVAIACIATPWFTPVVVALMVIFYAVQKFFRRSSRELKRIEGISRSPIFSGFEETLSGLATIRAHAKQDQFVKEMGTNIDINSKLYLGWQLTSRWLAVRLDFISVLVITISAVFMVSFRSSLDVAIGGLALTCTMQLTGLLQWTVRCSVEVENNMTAVERILEFTTIAQETPFRGADKPIVVPDNWPSEGRITFDNVRARYRPELPLCLSGIAADIKPREKIGICGRTGSGKSSICLCLLRVIERDLSGGQITIDGVPIEQVELPLLRQRISVIPQDSVMFSGSVRENLDPFHLRSDEDLWSALADVHMKTAIAALPLGLDEQVAERGGNFSHGQRQLLCIARAVLRQSMIIICDEATSGIDTNTDQLVQQSIRTLFKDRTVLTVAHRLESIADSDRIMVISGGCVDQFDTPANLMRLGGGSYLHDTIASGGPQAVANFNSAIATKSARWAD